MEIKPEAGGGNLQSAVTGTNLHTDIWSDLGRRAAAGELTCRQRVVAAQMIEAMGLMETEVEAVTGTREGIAKGSVLHAAQTWTIEPWRSVR